MQIIYQKFHYSIFLLLLRAAAALNRIKYVLLKFKIRERARAGTKYYNNLLSPEWYVKRKKRNCFSNKQSNYLHVYLLQQYRKNYLIVNFHDVNCFIFVFFPRKNCTVQYKHQTDGPLICIPPIYQSYTVVIIILTVKS